MGIDKRWLGRGKPADVLGTAVAARQQGNPSLEAEKEIALSAYWSFVFALKTQERFQSGEPAILADNLLRRAYLSKVVPCHDATLEQLAINTSPLAALEYATVVSRRKLPEDLHNQLLVFAAFSNPVDVPPVLHAYLQLVADH